MNIFLGEQRRHRPGEGGGGEDRNLKKINSLINLQRFSSIIPENERFGFFLFCRCCRLSSPSIISSFHTIRKPENGRVWKIQSASLSGIWHHIIYLYIQERRPLDLDCVFLFRQQEKENSFSLLQLLECFPQKQIGRSCRLMEP